MNIAITMLFMAAPAIAWFTVRKIQDLPKWGTMAFWGVIFAVTVTPAIFGVNQAPAYSGMVLPMAIGLAIGEYLYGSQARLIKAIANHLNKLAGKEPAKPAVKPKSRKNPQKKP